LARLVAHGASNPAKNGGGIAGRMQGPHLIPPPDEFAAGAVAVVQACRCDRTSYTTGWAPAGTGIAVR
jgi:hypothetical protein